MESQLIPVRLTLISSSHNDRGDAEEPIRMMTTGQLRQTPRGFMLRYEENLTDEDTGRIQTSPVIMTMQPGRVVMNRLGDFGTTLVFVKDTRFEGPYRTPYGEMDLAIYTTHVSTKLSPEKGSIRLEYQIDMNGGYAATQIIALDYVAEEQPSC